MFPSLSICTPFPKTLSLHYMGTTHRIEYLDIIKGIAIILVVIGHCCELPAHPTMLVKFIYAFHMPLFFLAAGMVVKTPQNDWHSDWQRFAKRFISIMVPYYLWCMIYMDCTMENFGKMFHASFQSIKSTGAECRQMWFLPCLFAAEIMIHSILKLTGRMKTVQQKLFLFCMAVLSFTVGFKLPKLEGGYPFSIDIAFVAVGIMLLGFICKDFISKLDASPFKFQLPLCVLSTVLLSVGVIYGSKDIMMKMCIASYGPVFWFFWNAAFGVIMVRSFSSILAKIGNSSRLAFVKQSALWIGRNTIGIYLLHMPLCYSIMNWMTESSGISIYNSAGNFIVGITVTVAAVILALVLNKLCPQVLGKAR